MRIPQPIIPVRPQQDPKVQTPWSPAHGDSGYTEPQLHQRYQNKEL